MKNSKQILESLDEAINSLSVTFGDEHKAVSFKKEMQGFKDIYSNYVEGRTKPIEWSKIKVPDASNIPLYDSINSLTLEQIREKNLASKLAVLKLNGGLGTTM